MTKKTHRSVNAKSTGPKTKRDVHSKRNKPISLSNPHDAFFKQMMTDLKKARQFFELYLPTHIKPRCDLATLRVKKASFVDHKLHQHVSDLLYSVQISEQTGYLYCLIEHVTQAKPNTAFQVLRYQIAAMHQAMKEDHDRPPIVVPFVFYRGQRSPYPESCDPFDCFENPQLARETLLTPHVLIDLSIMPDHEIAHHKDIALMEVLQKYALGSDLRDLVPYLTDPKFRAFLSTDDFKSVVSYLEAVGHSKDYEAFFEAFHRATHQPEDKTIMDTLGSYLKQKGMTEGIQQGIQQGIAEGIQQGMAEGIQREKQEIAKSMLQQGIDETLIETITRLSRQAIEELKKSLYQ